MSSPRAPFDQGLFLTHFNKGKELYEQRQYEAAERELEEAYLLRPRDPKVLNLLGLVYFKHDKLEKAEEIYRKLAAESPDAHTLYYNLGLIYFKLNRLEEAESTFLKALELSGENPKINFYLGSIYERLHRFQDAIFQYRQAGANLMVRRVEDKVAATAPPRRPPAVPLPSAPGAPPATPGTVPVSPAAPSLITRPATDDTAEYKASEVQEALRRKTASALSAKPLENVSDALMAEGSRRDVLSFPRTAGSSGPTDTQPIRREAFHFLRNNLMEVDFSGKVFIKQGSIYSYSGRLTFWVKEKRPAGRPPLVIVSGTGKLLLTDRERELTFMQMRDETVWIEPSHLLACEEGLTPRYVTIGEAARAVEMVALEGSGMVALSVSSKPLALSVAPEMPVSVPAASVITWSGTLTPQLVEDPQVYDVMIAPPSGRSLVRLEGTGRLLLEQMPDAG